MQFPDDTTATPLLVAANAAVQAWLYPTMDGKPLSKAMYNLERVVYEANREFRLEQLERKLNEIEPEPCQVTVTPNGNTVPKEPWDSGLPLFDVDCNVHGKLSKRNTSTSVEKIKEAHLNGNS